MQKLYKVHRMDIARDGGTQHHFSEPLPEPEAQQLMEEWGSQKVIDDGRHKHFTAKSWQKFWNSIDRWAVVLRLERHIPLRRYDDGKRRGITVKGEAWEWDLVDNVVTLYRRSQPVYKYTGDPHDKTPSGVRRIIQEI